MTGGARSNLLLTPVKGGSDIPAAPSTTTKELVSYRVEGHKRMGGKGREGKGFHAEKKGVVWEITKEGDHQRGDLRGLKEEKERGKITARDGSKEETNSLKQILYPRWP